jgi:HlyD family secretion protein
MRRHISRFLKFIKKKSVIAGGSVLVVISIYSLSHGSSPVNFESASVTVGNVIEKVSVTGTVSPVEKADLAFKKSGTISKIAVKVGDSIKKGDLIASLESAADAAVLASAQASLADLEQGLRPEQFALDQATIAAASTTLANAKKDAVNAVRDGYVKVQNALVNYSDQFFTNPRSVAPMISINTQSTAEQININNERVLVSTALSSWKTDSDTASSGNASNLISNAEGYLVTVKSFMSDLSAIVNNLTVGSSGMSRSTIDADVSTMNTALSTLTQAITSVSVADTELKNADAGFTQASNQFTLEKAGSSVNTIAAQLAKVNQAEATLNDDRIISPIDGIVTKADPNVGEFVAAGSSGFAVQTSGMYKIEAHVAEADIAKIVLDNIASSTLDAYGSNVDFPAQVTAIDPAETILENVPTYKVTLQFVAPDTRIRSGMTANLEILTYEADNVLQIPYRAVNITSTSTTVRLVSVDGKIYNTVPIGVGHKGSDGTIEVVSGLKEGDKVVTYVK